MKNNANHRLANHCYFFMIFNIVKGRIVYDYLVDSRKVNQYLLALYKAKIFQKIIRIKMRHTSKSPRIDCKKQFMQGLFL